MIKVSCEYRRPNAETEGVNERVIDVDNFKGREGGYGVDRNHRVV